MKLSSTLNTFLLLAACSTNFLRCDEFSLGSLDDLNEFDKYGICKKCNLHGFDLTKIIEKYKDQKIDLSGSDCSRANLSNVDLSGANLSEGNFQGANLQNSILKNVNAEKAAFSFSYMQNVNMQNANIKNASINNANLLGADFYGAKVNEKTFFKNSNCDSVDFRNIDLNKLKPPNFKGAILQNCKKGSTLSYRIRSTFAPILKKLNLI